MAADGLMSSYVGHGTHAARPATPNVIAGVSPVYYETDTTNTFIWTGSTWTQINGGGSTPSLSVSTKTTTYTITSTDDVILGDATSGAFTVTLPTAVGWTKRITVKKIDSSANAVTVGTTGGQTIDGITSRLLKGQFSTVTLISDNANWRVAEDNLPLTTAGDLLLGLANNDFNRLAIGASGTVLTSNGSTAIWQYPTLTTVSAQLSGNVTMTSANTFYDGASGSLTAGTWLASVSAMVGVSVTNDTWKLWDGTTNYASGELSTASGYGQMSLTYTVTPGSTLTHKMSVASTSVSQTIYAAAQNNAAGNTAASFCAVRVA